KGSGSASTRAGGPRRIPDREGREGFGAFGQGRRRPVEGIASQARPQGHFALRDGPGDRARTSLPFVIGLDTNVLVRYLTQDDPAQSRRANNFIADTAASGEPLHLSTIVL